MAHLVPGLSRRAARKAIATGAVRVNGRRARKGQRVAAGDVVELDIPAGLAPQADLPVAVIFEDPYLVAVDKPGGMPGHALHPGERATVANFLLARYPECAAAGEPLAAGLAHRIDTATSGLLLAARSASVHGALRAAFAACEVEKRYLAIVAGRVRRPGEVSEPLAHARNHRRMVPAREGLGRAFPAHTLYRPRGEFGSCTLLEVTLRTGVTHQVRAHLALIGHPLLGDHLYGGPPATPLPPGRHALHAARLSLRHPVSGEPLDIQSPLPADLRRLLDSLRGR